MQDSHTASQRRVVGHVLVIHVHDSPRYQTLFEGFLEPGHLARVLRMVRPGVATPSESRPGVHLFRVHRRLREHGHRGGERDPGLERALQGQGGGATYASGGFKFCAVCSHGSRPSQQRNAHGPG